MSALKILIEKIIKYLFLEFCLWVIEIVMESMGILSVFNVDVQYITLNMCLVSIGFVNIIVLLYLFKTRELESLFRKMLKRYFHFWLIVSCIAEIICMYKSQFWIQKIILAVEFLVVFLILEYEVLRLGKYNFYKTSSSYSNYVEKPVVGRENLTESQINTLIQLKNLIEHRNSTDSFNVALIGAWGAGKTSITDTLISEFEAENTYFILKIGALTLRNSSNIVAYVRDYFDILFRRYGIGFSRVNVSFLSSLASLLTNSQSVEKIVNSVNNNVFDDLEQEKEFFSKQVSKLLKKTGKKNVLFFIDDTDRCEDDDDIIKVLLEFASINGVISIISLDKSKDILVYKEDKNNIDKVVYNRIDKYIHVRIRMDEDNHIEYDKNITSQLTKSYDLIKHKECRYILCDGLNARTSLFDIPHDYQTTERVDICHISQSSANILTDLFFENLKNSEKNFGEYLGSLMNEYIYYTDELLPYISKMITIPREQWNMELHTLNAQWIDVIGKEFDWLMRLQSNAGTIFWTLIQMYESVELVANNEKVQDEINNIMDAFEYYMIKKYPIPGHTWDNRKENPVYYSGMENIKLLTFKPEEYENVNSYISGKLYEDAKNIVKERLGKVINLHYQSMILLDFIFYLRSILNNNRTFKMQLREAELLDMNYFDYIMREWQSSTEVFTNIEKMKEEQPVIKGLEVPVPSVTAIINNVLFENYIYKYGYRYCNNELKNSRIFIFYGEERVLICVSKNEGAIESEIFLSSSGDIINNLKETEIQNLQELRTKIWED